MAEGPDDVFSEMLKGTAKPEELTQGLGESWAVLDGYAKVQACCQHAHSAVEATQALRAELVARQALLEAGWLEHPWREAISSL